MRMSCYDSKLNQRQLAHIGNLDLPGKNTAADFPTHSGAR
jgi:hypothetical protein